MHIDWVSLIEVAVVAAAVAITVVLLVAFAMVGLSPRSAPTTLGGPAGSASGRPSGGGTAAAVLCLVAAASIVGVGLYVIVA